MTLPLELTEIDGAAELRAWFGYWPDFHDAEVVRLHLNRSNSSIIQVYTWEITRQIDSGGFYTLAKHILVELILDDIIDLSIGGFSKQNVLAGLDIEKSNRGYLIKLAPCYGLAGNIETTKLSIRLYPGKLGT